MLILGVSLGHQRIGAAFGGTLGRAGRHIHGRTSSVRHDRTAVFASVLSPLRVTRCHFLIVGNARPPLDLRVTARSEIMGLANSEPPIEWVQFQPQGGDNRAPPLDVLHDVLARVERR